jgi:hypothetical protein
MHKKSHHLLLLTKLSVATVCLWCMTTPAKAGPIVLQDAEHPSEAVVDTSKLVTMEPPLIDVNEAPSWDKSAATPAGKTSAPSKSGGATQAPANQPVAARTAAATGAAQVDGGAVQSLGKDIHDSIKETVRPMYEQLVESGAVEALHDAKESLGLNKSQWNEQGQANGPPKATGQWDTPDAGQPQRTAAQAQMDRELSAMMREKLIDQITPWAIGLVVLYALGYLIKLIYGYVRWKAARRSARRISRAKRPATHQSRSTSVRASSNTPQPKVDQKETM